MLHIFYNSFIPSTIQFWKNLEVIDIPQLDIYPFLSQNLILKNDITKVDKLINFSIKKKISFMPTVEKEGIRLLAYGMISDRRWSMFILWVWIQRKYLFFSIYALNKEMFLSSNLMTLVYLFILYLFLMAV